MLSGQHSLENLCSQVYIKCHFFFFWKNLLYLFGCYCSSNPGEIPYSIYCGSVLETNTFRYLKRKFLSSENQVLTILLERLGEQE